MTSAAGASDPHAFADPCVDADLRRAGILIADDEPLICRLLSGILKKQGFVNLRIAEGGKAALDTVHSFRPDLVLLDMQMPDLSGLDVCRQVRTCPEFVDVPILVQTATVDRKEMGNLFAAGASDFLSKPINPSELVARVVVHLERQKLLRGMREYRDRISQELEAARRMQFELLPSAVRQQELAVDAGLRIGSYNRSSSEIGGDIWGVLPIAGGRLGIFLADFTGHGVTAALNTFRLHALIHEYRTLHDDPAGLLSKLNERLVQLLPAGQFATFLYLIVDCAANTVRFSSAGAPPIASVPGLSGRSKMCEAPGVPLGIAHGMHYEEHICEFGPDSRMLIFSDGLSEFSKDSGDRIGESGVMSALDSCHPVLAPHEVIHELCRAAGIAVDSSLPDDTTIICIDRRVGASMGAVPYCTLVTGMTPAQPELQHDGSEARYAKTI